MDFVHDQLFDGPRFRVLTVIDRWGRESLSVEPGFALTGTGVAAALDAVARRRPLTKTFTVDHGTDFASRALDEWVWQPGSSSTSFVPGSLWKTACASR